MIAEAQEQTHSHEKTDLKSTSSRPFPPSVVVIERQALIRECLALSLQKMLTLPILTYGDLDSWRQHQAGFSAAVILLGGLGTESNAAQLQIVRELSEECKSAPVVVLSDNDCVSHIANILSCGAKGYILSNTPLDIAAAAINVVLAGGIFVPANMATAIQQRVLGPAGSETKSKFTVRENDVANALLQGKSNKAIAHELSMSESSVKVHVGKLMRKLQARNRTEAVIKIGKIISQSI